MAESESEPELESVPEEVDSLGVDECFLLFLLLWRDSFFLSFFSFLAAFFSFFFLSSLLSSFLCDRSDRSADFCLRESLGDEGLGDEGLEVEILRDGL